MTPAKRREEIRRAKRLHIAQMVRAGGVYSTGTEILEGPALKARIQQELHVLISSRGPRKIPDTGRMWHNASLVFLSRMHAGTAMKDRLAHQLRAHAAGTDFNSAMRATIMRRALRKSFRETYAQLPIEIAKSPAERSFISDMSREPRLMIARDVQIGDAHKITIPAGVPVVRKDGNLIANIPAFGTIRLPHDVPLKRRRLRHTRPGSPYSGFEAPSTKNRKTDR